MSKISMIFNILIICTFMLNSVYSRLCTQEEGEEFQKVIFYHHYGECDETQYKHGIKWDNDSIQKHGTRKLFKKTCLINTCIQAYADLVKDNIVPDCEIELADGLHNMKELITDTHHHCQKYRN